MKRSKIYVAGGKRPIWQTIVAAGIMTVGIYLAAIAIYYGFRAGTVFKGIMHGLEVLLYAIGFSTPFMITRGIHIDTEKSRFKNVYQLGTIKLGEWKPIIDPEYVSVFQ